MSLPSSIGLKLYDSSSRFSEILHLISPLQNPSCSQSRFFISSPATLPTWSKDVWLSDFLSVGRYCFSTSVSCTFPWLFSGWFPSSFGKFTSACCPLTIFTSCPTLHVDFNTPALFISECRFVSSLPLWQQISPFTTSQPGGDFISDCFTYSRLGSCNVWDGNGCAWKHPVVFSNNVSPELQLFGLLISLRVTVKLFASLGVTSVSL